MKWLLSLLLVAAFALANVNCQTIEKEEFVEAGADTGFKYVPKENDPTLLKSNREDGDEEEEHEVTLPKESGMPVFQGAEQATEQGVLMKSFNPSSTCCSPDIVVIIDITDGIGFSRYACENNIRQLLVALLDKIVASECDLPRLSLIEYGSIGRIRWDFNRYQDVFSLKKAVAQWTPGSSLGGKSVAQAGFTGAHMVLTNSTRGRRSGSPAWTFWLVHSTPEQAAQLQAYVNARVKPFSYVVVVAVGYKVNFPTVKPVATISQLAYWAPDILYLIDTYADMTFYFCPPVVTTTIANPTTKSKTTTIAAPTSPKTTRKVKTTTTPLPAPTTSKGKITTTTTRLPEPTTTKGKITTTTTRLPDPTTTKGKVKTTTTRLPAPTTSKGKITTTTTRLPEPTTTKGKVKTTTTPLPAPTTSKGKVKTTTTPLPAPTTSKGKVKTTTTPLPAPTTSRGKVKTTTTPLPDPTTTTRKGGKGKITTTAFPDVTTPVVADDFCFQCRSRRNHKDLYADATECHHYYQCFYFNETFATGIRRRCADGLFWHDEILQCMPEGDTPCVDRCRDDETSARGCYSGNGCRQFYVCANTASYGMCCPPGSSFDEDACTCVESETCQDPCVQSGPAVQTTVRPAQQYNSTVCLDSFGTYIAAAAESNAFYLLNEEGNPEEKQWCPDGVSFDLVACRCDIEDDAVRPIAVERRTAIFWANFNSDIKDHSINKWATFSYDNVEVDNDVFAQGGGSLRADGGHISIPGLKTYDLRDRASFAFFFRCAGACSAGGILSNNKDASSSEFTAILGLLNGAFNGRLRFWHPVGVQQLTAALSSTASGWQHIAVTYDGQAIRLYLNGNLIDTEFVSGYLAIAHCPYAIAHDQGLGYFDGWIDDVLITGFAMNSVEIEAHRTGNYAYLREVGFFP